MTIIGEKIYDWLSLDKMYYLTYGRDVILQWVSDVIKSSEQSSFRILDIGCGHGNDLMSIKRAFPELDIELYGVECYPPNIVECKQLGITVFSIDMERNSIPVEDEFFDIVISNQFIEHTKDVFWIFSEISRVIKKGGVTIIGVPNLATWANRLWLLFGMQPSCINMLGPHVRGFTLPDFKRFVETDNYFKLEKHAGTNFWLPTTWLNNALSKTFPTLAVSIFFMLRRENKSGEFIHIFDTRQFETSFFKGGEK